MMGGIIYTIEMYLQEKWCCPQVEHLCVVVDVGQAAIPVENPFLVCLCFREINESCVMRRKELGENGCILVQICLIVQQVGNFTVSESKSKGFLAILNSLAREPSSSMGM